MTATTTPPDDILERICRENLAVYRESQGRLQEDVSQEAQVAHDYRGRLVYELLQNADDALVGVATTEDRALFRLTDEELWVANTGRPFTEADIRGLCGLGASSKAQSDGPKRASIGHKGLGFKSVLEITDSPEAYSETVSFRLGRERAEAQVSLLWEEFDRGKVRGVPAMRFPWAIAEVHKTWDELRAAGYHSAFRFPFHERVSSEQKAALAHQLLNLPMTSVLFLKHLEEVVIEVVTSSEESGRQWLLERHRVTSAGVERCVGLTESGLFRVDVVNREGAGDRYWVAHDGNVRIGDYRDGLTGPAWEGVDVTEVSVAVRDSDDPRVKTEDRRFHVFLPTQEPLSCSLLVNGAFTTDLSRQHVKVADTASNYNGYLVRRAAETFVQVLVPHLLAVGGPRYVLRVLDREESDSGSAGGLLAGAIAGAMTSARFLPSGPNELALNEAVFPSPVLDAEGFDFADLLKADCVVNGRQFPDPEFCEGTLARVCAAYGSVALSPIDSLRALAHNLDTGKTALRPGPDSRYRVDPVLDLCALLWERSDAADRQALEESARLEPVFPVGENDDGTVRRITLGGESAFYPPRSSAEELPLRKLQFLAHAVCWGMLGRTEQRSVLERQMKAWDALFDVKEFRFEEVMRAAVLPGLTRTAGADAELRESNRTIEALATICRLAGKTTKPDQPLPMGRLGSDRAFFNLSRLDVPCRADATGELTWAPAHQVYFGSDWVGDDSVESIVEAMAAAGEVMQVRFLASPDVFAEFSSTIGVNEEDDASPAAIDPDEGEVDLDDDTDEALETTVDDRWRNFFAWLGVSRGLRLIHFHDVDDTGTGWTNTKGLGLPGGWAFSGLDKVWSEYQADLVGALSSDPRWEQTDHYLYQVHNLDRLDEIARVALRRDNDVAEKLLDHLVRNWNTYASHTQAKLAFVGAGKWPSTRTAPPRATSEELVNAGPDLWLYRLRHHAICPTSHGPRRPNQSWRRSEELVRRLGRSGRDADDYLPVLKQPTGVPTSTLRACLDELQVRGELTPAAFNVEDAHDLCVRISHLHPSGITDQALRSELRPIYRQMFELLVGSTVDNGAPLTDTPLAARTAAGYEFLAARDVVYASVSGSRERSGVQDKVPLFVLEAEPGALRPLRELFGTPLLESALEWSVMPGETALEASGLGTLRQGLRDLVAPLLARLSADRADRGRADRLALTEFAEKLEPVDTLSLSCSFRGQNLGQIPQRTYYVRRSEDSGFQGFAVWSGPAWPPIAEDAHTLAMALAETLEVNTVETFLSFINANPAQRQQLLDLAGAAEKLEEVQQDLADLGGDAYQVDQLANRTEGNELDTTDGESTEAATGHADRTPPAGTRAAPRIPLHRYEDLMIDGEVIRIEGSGPQHETTGSNDQPGAAGDGRDDDQGGGSSGAPRAAAGTDLNELDQLGMRITFAFEERRFVGQKTVVLPGETPSENADLLIVDVSSPEKIRAAIEQSTAVERVFDQLAEQGVSEVYPGFDVLTIEGGSIDRMIELKSSGVDAQVQAMSWNEWKTAGGELRGHFWLYLVGNLRADLENAPPFVRAVQDPFGTLASSKSEDVIRKRTVQLRVREFAAADQLTLELRHEEDAPA
ncbi:DUF3883 domain-containing protein [Paenarthrobacter sp. MSM-2-10-13]|uniref:sacsin N-terminal ATP-binding-like domain-containing protein n=1 Tax=Paenarthrobacter sp. MSM-2-10-13 TaxID=2717318 RepID=UPI001421376D|nr:DUF3883 domain-containing protein [Paenarthrobacter sp. MSM-2-10-13]